jgi:invasion protein IalB
VKTENQNDLQVCYIGEDAHTPSGRPVVAAVLIEPANDPRKILRLTVPLGMRLGSGTWVEIDQGQPLNAPFLTCIDYGCVADYEASGDLRNEAKI